LETEFLLAHYVLAGRMLFFMLPLSSAAQEIFVLQQNLLWEDLLWNSREYLSLHHQGLVVCLLFWQVSALCLLNSHTHSMSPCTFYSVMKYF